MKFVIDTKKWRTGSNGPNKTGEGDTFLLNKEGFMCCLGMCLEQIGFDHHVLLDVANPANVKSGLDAMKIFRTNVPNMNTDLSVAAMNFNDSPLTTIDEKKEKLIKLFANNGHEIEFI